jgi:hypothetical protein
MRLCARQRYARAQPGWDETKTLGEDLLELRPVRWFLDSSGVPCFALVFTDRATLALAEVLAPDGAKEGLQIVTVYVIHASSPRVMSALRLKLLLDAQTGDWPRLLEPELRFAEDDDLDAVLESAGEARVLVQLIVNAILYATSASVSWPIAASPIRSLKSSALG